MVWSATKPRAAWQKRSAEKRMPMWGSALPAAGQRDADVLPSALQTGLAPDPGYGHSSGTAADVWRQHEPQRYGAARAGSADHRGRDLRGDDLRLARFRSTVNSYNSAEQ